MLAVQSMAADISRMNVAPVRIHGTAQAVARDMLSGSSPPASLRTLLDGPSTSSTVASAGMGSPPTSDGFNPFATPLPRVRGAEAANGPADMLSPHRYPADRNHSALGIRLPCMTDGRSG